MHPKVVSPAAKRHCLPPFIVTKVSKYASSNRKGGKSKQNNAMVWSENGHLFLLLLLEKIWIQVEEFHETSMLYLVKGNVHHF